MGCTSPCQPDGTATFYWRNQRCGHQTWYYARTMKYQNFSSSADHPISQGCGPLRPGTRQFRGQLYPCTMLAILAFCRAVMTGPMPALAASTATGNSTVFHGIVIAGHRLGITSGRISFTGRLQYANSRAGKVIRKCDGTVIAGAKTIWWPAHGKSKIKCDSWQLTGTVHRFTGPAHVSVTLWPSVTTSFAALTLWNQKLAKGTALLSVSRRAIKVRSFTAKWHRAEVAAQGQYFSAARSANVRLTIGNLQQRYLFALLSPKHFTITGQASLHAAVNVDLTGNIIGTADLRSTGPGTLYVRDIPVLENALARVYGKGLATVTVLELKAFPYTSEHLRIATGRHESVISVSLKRGLGNPANIKPRMITINGHRFLFKADNMPTIHFTLPLPNISLKRLIQIANGQYAVVGAAQ